MELDTAHASASRRDVVPSSVVSRSDLLGWRDVFHTVRMDEVERRARFDTGKERIVARIDAGRIESIPG